MFPNILAWSILNTNLEHLALYIAGICVLGAGAVLWPVPAFLGSGEGESISHIKEV